LNKKDYINIESWCGCPLQGSSIQQIRNFFEYVQMDFMNNIQDKANIPPDILWLLTNAFPYLFGGTFLRFGKLQVIPAGCLAPRPGLFQLVSFAVYINNVLQLFSYFIQKLEILWVGNVNWTAGGVHNEGTLVLTGVSAILVVVIILIPLMRNWPAEQQWLRAESASGIPP